MLPARRRAHAARARVLAMRRERGATAMQRSARGLLSRRTLVAARGGVLVLQCAQRCRVGRAAIAKKRKAMGEMRGIQAENLRLQSLIQDLKARAMCCFYTPSQWAAPE